MVYGHQRSGLLTTKLGILFWIKGNFASLAGRKGEALFEFDAGLALPRNCSLQRAGDGLRGKVMQRRINRKPRGGLRQGKFRVDGWVFERDLTCGFQVDRFPDACVSVRHEGSIELMFPRVLAFVSQIFPVDPIEPTVRQFHTVDVLNQLLGCDFYGQRILRSWLDPLRHIELVSGIHADDLLVVRHLLPVDPDFGAVVNSRELESVVRETSRRSEYSAIPPVLLVQILRDLLEHVLADIQVGVDTILLQDLENSCGHATDRMPLPVLVIGRGDRCTFCPSVFRSRQFPVVRQLQFARSVRRTNSRRDE